MKKKRETLEIPKATNTHASNYEPTYNNNGLTRRSDATRLLRNALMNLYNRPKHTHWVLSGNYCHSGFLIRPRKPRTNQGGANVRPLTSKSIWALGHGSIVWPRDPTFVPIGIPARAHNNYEPNLGVVQIPEKRTTDSNSRIAQKVIPGQYANDRSHCLLSARQCLRKLRRRTYMLQREPFPKPLTPKHPLKINDIGPLIALV